MIHDLLRGLLPALFLLAAVEAAASPNPPDYYLAARFDLDRNLLRGAAKITLPQGQPIVVNIAGLNILSAAVNGVPIKPGSDPDSLTVPSPLPGDVLTIEYETAFRPAEDEAAKGPGAGQANAVSRNGISLFGGWYPSIGSLFRYRLSATLPKGFEGISEAEEIVKRPLEDGSNEFVFLFPSPLPGITFFAGEYSVGKEIVNGTEIYTYFFPGDAALAKTYTEHAGKYLAMYGELLVPYPFRRFSIVEGISTAGSAMPTFTLLGRDVLKLPFIVNTSLGHEVLHQWFGNYVFIDSAGGNWAEGLTTYLADHRYEEMKGEGADNRRQMLITYQSHVTTENDVPLQAFTGKADRAKNAIGYGKSAMLFHMLKNLVGETEFYEALRAFIGKRAFQYASWNDIREVFGSISGKDLDWFFRQWLEEKGGPDIEVKNANVVYRGAKAIVSCEILQKGKSYRFALPVTVKMDQGHIRRTFEIEKESTSVEIETEGTPLSLVLDETYDVFRRLADSEFPPVVSRLLGDAKKIFVIPGEKEKDYAPMADYLKKEGFTVKNGSEIVHEDIRTSSLLLAGGENSVAERLFGKIGKQPGDFNLQVRENPFNRKGVIAVIDGTSPADMANYLPRTTHFGKYSRVSFRDGKNTLKEISETGRGMVAELSGAVIGVEMPRALNLQGIIDKVSSKKIIYVGELHDRFDHHRIQFEVIRALHRKNRDIAIGMEMFQKPFQQALDDYISGSIGEREFLKKSEYFKRWGFDYNLYREILSYAREYGIPVVALNIRKEIVSKVSKEGLYALKAEDLKEVPEDIDLSDSEYRDRLKGYFAGHKGADERSFDFFYQAQVLWDESMAHNLNDYMQKNPGRQIIVLAGGGHMAFGSGIPKRAFRLNGKEYAVLLNSSDIKENVADFLLFPEALQAPEAPRLGVSLKEEAGQVKIADISPQGLADRGGLRKDDILLSIDETKIEAADEVRIFLLYAKKGDSITVTVSRKRFLFGPVEKKFTIVL